MRLYSKVLAISFSLPIIPLVLVGWVLLYNTQKELTGEIDQRLDAVSELKKDRLEAFFNSRNEDLKAIQGFLDVQINLPTLQEFDQDRYSLAYTKAKLQLDDQLRAFMNSRNLADILLMDKKGKAVFVANPAHVHWYRDRVLFNETVLNKARNHQYISGPIATQDWKYPNILYMISGAQDSQGGFTGYIVLVVDMNIVYDLIADNTGLGKTGESFLVKKMPDQGFLIISPLLYDSHAIFNKEIPFSMTDVKINDGIDYKGNEALSVWQDLPSLDWRLVTKIDKQEVYASIANIRTLFFIICTLILVMIVLGSVFFAEVILGPVQKLQELTIHDPLTGALNRRGLQEVLSKTFAIVQRMDINVLVLLLDLDDFKQINDRHGHGVGDAVLVAVTEKVRQTVRKTDYVARVGGDEFMVLLMDSRDGDVIKVADKIRLAVSQILTDVSSGQTIKTTCSIGITPLGTTTMSIDDLLQKLHASLHFSKSSGKNRVSFQAA